MTTVAFCEVDPWCRRVLAKHWPDVPCHDDVRTLKGEDVGAIDLICGGYPCTPFSQAGQRRGAEDDRHLWPEMHRLVAAIRPRWVLCENVVGHISMGLDDVLSDLEGEGYTCQTFVVGAVAVDSPHRRQRIWVVANADDTERRALNTARQRDQGRDDANGLSGRQQVSSRSEPSGEERAVADAHSERQQEQRQPIGLAFDGVERGCRWLPEPDVGFLVDGLSAGLAGLTWPPEPDDVPRVAKGVSNRVSKLKALGNAVVPQIPEMIGRAIMAAHT
jgi:DNA (cytosine-5)-methyltransferase 1